MGVDSSNNKRIVQNTLFLYFRMFITMGVALYTSRIVLDVLGIEDYGIYNVVGGVVSLLAFLRGALSTSTSRFLSYELGAKNEIRLRETFRTALALHLVLALFLFLVLETFGLWFVYSKLTIPDERMSAAVFVYHFSVITCCLQIFQLPFNSAIISHERMGAFAYISVIEVVLKLVIVYFLEIGCFDRLKFYAVLMFCITSLISGFYVIYSLRNFNECDLRVKISRSIARPMLTFSGWDLYGTLSVAVRGQGLNVLQNMFFGPVVNAATGVANQVMHAIMGFATNFMVAIRPQIYKSYAAKEWNRFSLLINNSSKFCFLLLFVLSFPLLLEAEFVMKLWLKEVPDFAVVFCQLSIVNNWISVMFRPIVYGIHATGNVKRISIINGSIYLAVLPLSYFFLKMGGGPVIPFILNIILLTIGHFIFTLNAFKREVPMFSRRSFLKKSPLIIGVIALLSSLPPIFLHIFMQEGWFRLFLVIVVFLVVVSFLIFCIALNDHYRRLVIIKIKNITKNIKI